MRSSGVAWTNRGYHSSGTEMVRPSASSAVSVVSEAATVRALASSQEQAIPFLQKLVFVILYYAPPYVTSDGAGPRKRAACSSAEVTGGKSMSSSYSDIGGSTSLSAGMTCSPISLMERITLS